MRRPWETASAIACRTANPTTNGSARARQPRTASAADSPNRRHHGKKRGTFRPGARSISAPLRVRVHRGNLQEGARTRAGTQSQRSEHRALPDAAALLATGARSPPRHEAMAEGKFAGRPRFPDSARPHGATPRSALRALGQGELSLLEALMGPTPCRSVPRAGSNMCATRCRSIYQDRQREDRSPSRKLGEPQAIETVPGVGYRMAPQWLRTPQEALPDGPTARAGREPALSRP